MSEAAKFGIRPFHPVMAMIAIAASKVIPTTPRGEKVIFAIAVRDEIVGILTKKALGAAVDADLLDAIPSVPDGAALFEVTAGPWKREIDWTREEEAEGRFEGQQLRDAAKNVGEHYATLEERQAAQKRVILIEETAKLVLEACAKRKITVELWKDGE